MEDADANRPGGGARLLFASGRICWHEFALVGLHWVFGSRGFADESVRHRSHTRQFLPRRTQYQCRSEERDDDCGALAQQPLVMLVDLVNLPLLPGCGIDRWPGPSRLSVLAID